MSFRERPLLYDMRGGSLYISLNRGWCLMRCQLFMSTGFRLGTAGWYFVTKGKIFFCSFCFCWSARFLSLNVTSVRVLRIKSSGYPLSRRRDLNFFIFSSNSVLEELVLRSLTASPLINPLLTPYWWHEEK